MLRNQVWHSSGDAVTLLFDEAVSDHVIKYIAKMYVLSRKWNNNSILLNFWNHKKRCTTGLRYMSSWATMGKTKKSSLKTDCLCSHCQLDKYLPQVWLCITMLKLITEDSLLSLFLNHSTFQNRVMFSIAINVVNM